MTATDIPDPIWVNSTSTLRSMQEDLQRQTIIAVDTESNSLHAYRERVCLIQFSTAGHDYLVDPLAEIDLTSLGEIFSSTTMEKVFHAAEYDIICLRRDYGFTFSNIFDTMQAARILGRQNVSLGDQLQIEFDLHLDKRYQKADWVKRPLPPAMQTYACLDTHYLLPLRDRMKMELQRKGLLDLAVEDFARLCQAAANENHKQSVCQIRGYQELNSRQLAVLNELCQYRDQRARTTDKPLFKVIGNAALLELARTCPLSMAELQKVRQLSPRLRERHAENLLDAIRMGMKAPLVELTRTPRPDYQFLCRLDKLKEWRKRTAQQMGVVSDVILPRDLLELIASRNPASQKELRQLMQSIPWRFARFGKEIQHVIKE